MWDFVLSSEKFAAIGPIQAHHSVVIDPLRIVELSQFQETFLIFISLNHDRDRLEGTREASQ